MEANPNLAELSRADRGKLESWLVRFDQSWKGSTLGEWIGRLDELPLSLRPAALAEIVKIDLERQWQQGEQVLLESYLQRWPGLGTPQTVSAELICAEYEARRQAGAPAPLADFVLRFPRQESFLRELVERVETERSEGGLPSGRPKAQAERDTSREDLSTRSPAAARKPKEDLPEEFGRYRILKKLGAGGMGTVYLAHDAQLDRQVALKTPRFSQEDGPQVMERFLREARAAATLRHPNVCPVHDVGEIEGVHYLTMAYIEGRTLLAFIRPDRPLPERQVAAVVRKLALALEEAHRHGIIHRDLKPSNVMIDQRHEPVIMDFGLARRPEGRESHITQTGALLGTPAYMSPEQVLGEPDQIGPQADVYSLGVILYQLLTGRVPFEGPATAVIGQILAAEPPPPQEFRPDLDPTLVGICLKAMAKKREERYQSMKQLAAALEACLQRAKSSVTVPPPVSKRPPAAPPLPGEPARPPHEETSLAEVFAELAAAADRPGTREWPGHRVSTHRPKRSPLGARHRNLIIGLATAAVLLLVALGVVLRMRTRQGTLEVYLDDPDAIVQVLSDEGKVVVERKGEEGRLTIGVDPGKGRLRVEKDGIELFARDFVIARGGKEIIKAELHPPTEPPPATAGLTTEAVSTVADPEGNLIGDQSLRFLDIVAASVDLRDNRYVFSATVADDFPGPEEFPDGGSILFIFYVDIDRNSKTGQSLRGNDYNLHLSFIRAQGWHGQFFKVSSVSQSDPAEFSADDVTRSCSGNTVTMSFPASYLPSASFDWWVTCRTVGARRDRDVWPLRTINPDTPRGTFIAGGQPAPQEGTGKAAGDASRPWPSGTVRIVVATDSDWYGLVLSDDVQLDEVLQPPGFLEGEKEGYKVGAYRPEDHYTHQDPRRVFADSPKYAVHCAIDKPTADLSPVRCEFRLNLKPAPGRETIRLRFGKGWGGRSETWIYDAAGQEILHRVCRGWGEEFGDWAEPASTIPLARDTGEVEQSPSGGEVFHFPPDAPPPAKSRPVKPRIPRGARGAVRGKRTTEAGASVS